MTLKVVVNVASISPPLAGIGRYSRYLVESLMTSDLVSHIEGFTPYRTLDRSAIKQKLLMCDSFTNNPLTMSARSNVERVIKRSLQGSLTAYQLRRLVEHSALKLRSNYDAGSVYWDPGFLRLPIDLPSITTVYDLSHIAHPECHPRARVALLNQQLANSIDQSQRIVTISEFSKQEIIKTLAVDESKIFVVPPGVSEEFRKTPSASSLLAVRQHYSLPEKFILSICTLEPRKNLISLITAFRLLPKAVRQAYPLVLVGNRGWKNDEMDRLLDDMARSDEVVLIGYANQHDLPIFYRLATMLVYVSLYEGYGMPIAEAMVSGTPVITSNCSSMPEVANGACLLVEPLDEKMISQAMLELIEDDKLRHHNIELGLTKAADYTWQASSIKLIQAMSGLC